MTTENTQKTEVRFLDLAHKALAEGLSKMQEENDGLLPGFTKEEMDGVVNHLELIIIPRVVNIYLSYLEEAIKALPNGDMIEKEAWNRTFAFLGVKEGETPNE